MSYHPETHEITKRYARRNPIDDRYNPLNAAVYLSVQEKERAIINLLKTSNLAPLNTKRMLEIGCGSGGNLLQFIKLGAEPHNLVANELLEDRLALARVLLPSGVTILPGDASELSFDQDSFDIIIQSTVFSSLLDDTFQALLAARMWHWTKPGGGILWYDFTYNNPRNPDVRGMPLRRIRALFPEAQIRAWRLTLAPPLSRRVTRLHPNLYHLFNLLPFLRTHLLCWIAKPRGTV